LTYKSAGGVFRTPGDQASLTKLGDVYPMYCGDHLISVTTPKAVELDPNTFAVQRQIAGKEIDKPLTFTDPRCSPHYIYFTSYDRPKTRLLAYPLDQ
jgi:hypothetical protein